MTENNAGIFTIPVISFLLSLITSYTIFIKKHSKMQFDIDENKKDINGIGKKVRELDEQGSANTIMLAEKMDKMSTVLVETTTSLKHLQEDIKEIKTDVKDQSKGYK